MKRRLAMTWLIATLTAFLLSGCGQAGPEREADDSRDDPSERDHSDRDRHATLPGDEPMSGSSVYQLEGSFRASRTTQMQLSELRGHPVLLVMFYGTCEYACPALVHDLQRIEEQLAEDERRDTRFVLVTFDPEIDTPERLAEYALTHDLDPERWLLLNGASDQIRELALVLGVRYRPTGNGAFSHTSRITLLDREGAIAARVDGLVQDPAPILQRLHELQNES